MSRMGSSVKQDSLKIKKAQISKIRIERRDFNLTPQGKKQGQETTVNIYMPTNYTIQKKWDTFLERLLKNSNKFLEMPSKTES